MSVLDATRESLSQVPRAERLVWCQERAYKEDASGVKSTLLRAAQLAGVQIVCFKKAQKFANWRARNGGEPYVLLTDWRELKPCFEGMLGHEQARLRPVLTVVVCSEDGCLQRATSWAAARRREAIGRIHVGADLDFLLAYLEGLRGSAPEGEASARPLPQGPPEGERDADPVFGPWLARIATTLAPESGCFTLPLQWPADPEEPVKLPLAPRPRAAALPPPAPDRGAVPSLAELLRLCRLRSRSEHVNGVNYQGTVRRDLDACDIVEL